MRKDRRNIRVNKKLGLKKKLTDAITDSELDKVDISFVLSEIKDSIDKSMYDKLEMLEIKVKDLLNEFTLDTGIVADDIELWYDEGETGIESVKIYLRD